MSHYFTNDYVKSDKKIINVKIGESYYSFNVDNGVFSKSGLDFGTRTLLESLNLEEIKGDVLDFGCGYGPIGIYIASNTSSDVDMVDVNERSLALAKENALLNKVDTHIFKSDIYESIDKKYDFIVTNPPIRVGKKILYDILFGATNHLKDHGEMWLVINKDQGAKSLVKDLSEVYDAEVIRKNKGFYIIKAKKR
ncbi:MAG: class I SAM-dependent methyltransferase [Bacilli bacterium]|nr:class I SAM-dependent methyltransferase [Bacilli bacterium]